MEKDDIYVCSWSRSDKGFTLWLKSHPRVRGVGRKYADAEKQLLDAIHSASGVISATLEFDPPLPITDLAQQKYSSPEIYLICGDEHFETNSSRRRPFETPSETHQRLKDLDVFYTSPVCRKCKHATSERSEVPLTVASVSSKYDGAFGFVGNEGGPSIQLVSDKFVNLLTSDERQSIELRPVMGMKKGRRFFEVLGPSGPPFVGVTGLPAQGWRCTDCTSRTWGYFIPDFSIHSFVCQSDLSSRPTGVFTVGTPPDIQLVATAQRWRELVGREGTRGFVSSLLGVAPPAEVIRFPELPLH